MSRSLRISLLLIAVSFSSLYADAIGINHLTTDFATKIDNEVEGNSSGYTFLKLALVIGGEVAYTKAYGDDNIDQSHCWASISKPITAMVVMNLWEQGLIESLDDNIGKYSTKYADAMPAAYAGDSITFRQIMTHTSGIPHYEAETFVGDKLNLQFKPGTQFHYSTHAWGVLGDVLEDITGKGYQTLMDEYIAAPAGASTFYASTQDSIWRAPGGYVYSKIEDMGKISIGVMNHIYVTEQTLKDEMAGPFPAPAKNGRGLGWALKNRTNNRITYWHNGSHNSEERLSTYLGILPDKKLSVSIIARNGNSTVIDQIGKALELMLELERNPTAIAEFKNMDRPAAAGIEAVYNLRGQRVLHPAVNGMYLVTDVNGNMVRKMMYVK